ncbi:hypothetical protein [Sorangium sp. So ce1151]|uniref:hypothetical protein n=1 Tax=Sorangium sp. So ce1151 TaxID=3133332 RepID=UPI003F62F3D4
MSRVLSQLTVTARDCRRVVEEINALIESGIEGDEFVEALSATGQSAHLALKRIIETALVQIDGILDATHDANVQARRDAIVVLLEEAPDEIQMVEADEPGDSDEEEEDECEDGEDDEEENGGYDVDELAEHLDDIRPKLVEIAQHIDYVVAYVSHRSAMLPSVHHHYNTTYKSTISGSTVGAIALGDQARSDGAISSNSDEQSSSRRSKSRSRR